MACVLRTGISKLRIGSTGLCKITSTNNVPHIQVASISTREVRKERPPRPAPFPYNEKQFNIWQQLFDDTTFRFDDNTKLIAVEGPPAVGKGELCKKLAHELDMLYVPQTYLEDHIVREFNFDLRTVDDKLPESCRQVDLPTFLKNPTLRNGAVMQYMFYFLRYRKWIQILAHILSTGQGVVTERSPWSDQCFANVMHINGYLSDKAFETYNTVVEESLHELMMPHLIIYLDATVKTVQEKIKKRNDPAEVNSKVLNEKFLTDLENDYKYKFLRKMNDYSHILIYDYSQGGDFEVVVEDIEALDFDKKDKDSKKFLDWDLRTNVQWTTKRRNYSDDEEGLLTFCLIRRVIAEEMRISPGDAARRRDVLEEFAPRQCWDSAYFPLKNEGKKFLRAAD